ncbi:MAG: IS3 family transposase [Candidatus Cyclobacteriaceae bacterium M2_1C_046]
MFQYVEGWYNRERIHSSIDYTSPMEKSKQTLKLVA